MKATAREVFWLAFLLVITAFVAVRVLAHSDGKMIYPSECCSGFDCAPATVVGSIGVKGAVPSQMTVTTNLGTVTIPSDFKKIFESKDHRVHACLIPGPKDWEQCGEGCGEYAGPPTPYIDPQARCVFLPPAM
jgi:hypothetical protein